MQWEASGSNAQTGRPATLVVEADDEASATRRAARRGLRVTGVMLMPDSEPEDPVATEPEPEPEPAADYVDLGTASQSAAPIPYAGPSAAVTLRHRGQVPHYRGIVTGAKVLNVLAGIYAFSGALTILMGFGSLLLWALGGARSGQAGAAAFAVVFGSVQAIAFVLAGLVQLAIAALIRMVAVVGLAVRDMARNSFMVG